MNNFKLIEKLAGNFEAVGKTAKTNRKNFLENEQNLRWSVITKKTQLKETQNERQPASY